MDRLDKESANAFPFLLKDSLESGSVIIRDRDVSREKRAKVIARIRI